MNKGSLTTVFLVVLVDLIGFGLVLPLLPFYAGEFDASPVMIGLLYSIYSVMQLIFSPIWGSYSDRIGRRPIMLISTAGAVVAYIIFGLAGSLAVLFLSRMLAGIMGGSISTAQAYIADVTTTEERAKGMGMLGAAFGIGFVLGPALASGLIHPEFRTFFDGLGWHALASWMEANRYGLPGFFAAGLSLASFLLVYFKLPETVDTSNSGAAGTGARPGVFSAVFWRNLHRQSVAAGNYVLPLLLASIFVLSFGQASLYSAFPLFSEQQIGMSAEQVGIQFFYLGLITVIVQGGLIRPLTRWFKEEKLFLAGNIFMMAGMAAIATAGSVSMLTVYLGILALGHSLNLPTLNSLISKEADPEHMGAMMGTSQGLSGLGRAIGPTWGGALFSWSAGLPFVATAAVLLVTLYAGLYLITGRTYGLLR